MTKVIKLQPQYRERKYHRVQVVPKLTIQGNWLREAGFLPSKTVHVEVQSGKLVITSID